MLTQIRGCRMRPIFIATVLASGLFVGMPVFAQPSYDCSAQLNATERAICGDDRLARLDQEMASKFQRIYSHLAPERAQVFRQQQTNWRQRDRDACGSSTGCLRANYFYRIGIFDRLLDGSADRQTPEITRSASARVLLDGTIERRAADGFTFRRLPDGTTERYTPDGQKLPQLSYKSSVQPATLPPLPPSLESWGSALESSLLIILDNILTDDEYAAYQSTETDKVDYVLIDWRLRSISILTEP